MRQTILGLAAAIAVMAASSAPAMACGFGGCSPCGQEVFSPCAQQEVYAPPPPAFYNDCGGCGGWAHERLPNPVHQYYYVEQGPTYTGPGDWAPRRVYEENALPVWPYHHHHHYGHYHRYGYREYPLRRYY